MRSWRHHRSSGVNTVTGEGLAQALAGAQVVVDVANAPSWEDKAVLEFFETSGRNLLAAEAAAGVGHHVALSVVGTDRLLASGYFRAKMAQENLIKAVADSLHDRPRHAVLRVRGRHRPSGDGRADGSASTGSDAAHRVGRRRRRHGRRGPGEAVERHVRSGRSRTDPSRRTRAAIPDRNRRRTDGITDPKALYYGIAVNDQSLTPGDNPRLGPTRFEDWLSKNAKPNAAADGGA